MYGIPNVGKSSFINRLAKKASATVGNKPGVTKQKQWIRLKSNVELLDTPGILWPKFESQEVGLKLSFCNTIKDEVVEKTEIAYELIKFFYKEYRKNLLDRYKIEENEITEKDIWYIFNLIGQKRGAIVSQGKVSIDKTADIVLEDFRIGKLGKITLERNS